jgi:hypothetical protein
MTTRPDAGCRNFAWLPRGETICVGCAKSPGCRRFLCVVRLAPSSAVGPPPVGITWCGGPARCRRGSDRARTRTRAVDAVLGEQLLDVSATLALVTATFA